MTVEKATSDSRGIVTKPNHSMTFSEHGTPCVQGFMPSGITPAMPLLFGIGLAPLLQWIVIPPLCIAGLRKRGMG